MRKPILILLCFVVLAVGLGYAINYALPFPCYNDFERFEVTPYTELTKDFSGGKTFLAEVSNENSKAIRIATGDDTTNTDSDYWVMPSSSVGWENVCFYPDGIVLKFKADSETGTITLNVMRGI